MPPCTHRLSSTLPPQQAVFYARKAYPLLPMLDKVILRLHSSGILGHWIKQDWWEMAQGHFSTTL
ncbi:hypothetical protein FOCC_FOCC001936 [Frankliniella occidentalis]|nr:hypothetical protein FOCC_FOCC001936 [Frankliniella occidentalis]